MGCLGIRWWARGNSRGKILIYPSTTFFLTNDFDPTKNPNGSPLMRTPAMEVTWYIYRGDCVWQVECACRCYCTYDAFLFHVAHGCVLDVGSWEQQPTAYGTYGSIQTNNIRSALTLIPWGAFYLGHIHRVPMYRVCLCVYSRVSVWLACTHCAISGYTMCTMCTMFVALPAYTHAPGILSVLFFLFLLLLLFVQSTADTAPPYTKLVPGLHLVSSSEQENTFLMM